MANGACSLESVFGIVTLGFNSIPSHLGENAIEFNEKTCTGLSQTYQRYI